MEACTAKRVVCLQRFGECISVCVKHVRGRSVRFDYRKAGRKHIDVRKDRFDYRKMLGESVLTTTKCVWSLVEVRRVCFDNRKTCKILVVVGRVRFD